MLAKLKLINDKAHLIQISNILDIRIKKNMKIEVLATAPEASKCSGLFCDRQRTVEVIRGSRGCGCYSMQTRLSNVILVHDLKVKHDTMTIMTMNQFSSFWDLSRPSKIV